MTASESPKPAPTEANLSEAKLSEGNISHIIEMAWADEIPFDSIKMQYGLSESQVISLMRREMKASSFRMWRKRVTGRQSKHNKRSDLC